MPRFRLFRPPAIGTGLGKTLALGMIVIGLPLAFLLGIRAAVDDRLAELDPVAEPVVVTTRLETLDYAQPVVAALTRGPAPIIPAPDWSGLVTRVLVRPGDIVNEGDAVLSIDGINRVALATAGPLWRTLALGDTGEDVAWLQDSLMRLGYELASRGTFDSETAEATADLLQKAGGAPSAVRLDPAALVWLPTEQFEVTSVQVVSGTPAPTAGQPVATGTAPIIQADLIAATGEPLSLDPTKTWRFVVAGVEFALTDGSEPLVRAGDLDALGVLAGATAETVEGQVRLKEEIRSVVVPVTAVMTNDAGDLCIWKPMSTGFAATAVRLGPSTFTTVSITEGLEPGDRVLINPTDVLESSACP